MERPVTSQSSDVHIRIVERKLEVTTRTWCNIPFKQDGILVPGKIIAVYRVYYPEVYATTAEGSKGGINLTV